MTENGVESRLVSSLTRCSWLVLVIDEERSSLEFTRVEPWSTHGRGYSVSKSLLFNEPRCLHEIVLCSSGCFCSFCFLNSCRCRCLCCCSFYSSSFLLLSIFVLILSYFVLFVFLAPMSFLHFFVFVMFSFFQFHFSVSFFLSLFFYLCPFSSKFSSYFFSFSYSFISPYLFLFSINVFFAALPTED